VNASHICGCEEVEGGARQAAVGAKELLGMGALWSLCTRAIGLRELLRERMYITWERDSVHGKEEGGNIGKCTCGTQWEIAHRCVMRWPRTGMQNHTRHVTPTPSLPRVCKLPLAPHAHAQCGNERRRSSYTHAISIHPPTHPTNCGHVQPSPFNPTQPHQQTQAHTRTHTHTCTPYIHANPMRHSSPTSAIEETLQARTPHLINHTQPTTSVQTNPVDPHQQ
jgi:hypothetical protein